MSSILPPVDDSSLLDPEDPQDLAMSSTNSLLPQNPEELAEGDVNTDSPEEENIEGNAPIQEDEVRDALLNIFNIIEKEEQPARETLLKTYKYYDLLWEGIQPIFWNAVDRQWQQVDRIIRLPNNVVIDPLTFNKSINIIRSYGESISGAITTGVPKVNYFPENAELVDDIKTSQAYEKIERIIAEHNSMDVNLLKIAMTLWKFGFVAVYNYSHSSEDYGTIQKPVVEDVNYTNTESSCPNCGAVLNSSVTPVGTEKTDPLAGMDVGDEVLDRMIACEQCKQQVDPMVSTTQSTVPQITHFDTIPRARQLLEVLGPLEVKIPANARSQAEVLWVIWEKEFHYSQLRHKYPDYFSHINGGESGSASSYERWARSHYELDGGTLENLTTLDRVWIRPDAYCTLDKDLADKLYQLYPKGVYYAIINDEVVEIKEEKLDDCWTFSDNPGDRRLLAVAPAKNVVPIQELTNDVMSLQVKQFKHSIPFTFVNPETFSFSAYRNMRREPGQLFPMKPSTSDGKLSDNVAELHTAVMSKEVADLDAKLEKLGQFCSGAFPSVFGGEAAGSKTAFEYKESKNNALQRLGIIWKIVCTLYANFMHRGIKSFIDNMPDMDEMYTSKQGNSYINVWIKKAELQGKIGRVSAEVSEQFPTSWAQKRSTLMDLLDMQNEMINSVLFHPENINLLGQLIGIEDLYIPGDNDRNLQLEEIRQLITSEPIMDPMTGQAAPSVPIDPNLDNSNIHIETMRAFACSDIGIYVKENNPAGWQNFLLHLQAHQNYVQEQMMMQPMQDQANTEGQDQGGSAPPEGQTNG